MNMSVDDIVKKFEEHFDKMRDLLFDPICFRSTGSQCSKNTHSFLQYLLIKAGEDAGYISIPEVKMFLNLKENKLKKLWENFKNELQKELQEELGVNLESLNDKRMQTFKRVDVGFAKEDEEGTLTFFGFGEIYTIDGFLQSLKTEDIWVALKEYYKKTRKQPESKDFWITARDSILSLIENYKEVIRCGRKRTEKYRFDLKFVILVVVLPRRANLVWKDELMKLKEGSEILNCIKWDEVEDALKNNKNKSEYDYHEAHIECWKELKNEIIEISKNNLECRLLVITEEKDKDSDIFIVETIP